MQLSSNITGQIPLECAIQHPALTVLQQLVFRTCFVRLPELLPASCCQPKSTLVQNSVKLANEQDIIAKSHGVIGLSCSFVSGRVPCSIL
jgi:hypothetical protein